MAKENEKEKENVSRALTLTLRTTSDETVSERRRREQKKNKSEDYISFFWTSASYVNFYLPYMKHKSINIYTEPCFKCMSSFACFIFVVRPFGFRRYNTYMFVSSIKIEVRVCDCTFSLAVYTRY